MADFTYRPLGRKIVVRTGFYGTLEDPFPTHAHWCPACNEMHDYAVEKPFKNGAQWSFNGNLDSPSFNPSMNYSVGPMSNGNIYRCHYFVTAGRIIYQLDSTHSMSGQTVDLPDIPESETRKWS